MYSNQKLNWETGEFDTSYLSNNYCYFELIEDDTIDNIEELENEVMRDDWRYYVPLFFNKINELVRKYNELNKEIKELKER